MVETSLLAPLERLGLADVMLWLLSFALIYGMMTQAGIPKVRSARAIIAFVAAFLILIASPASLVTTVQNLGTGLLVALLGIIVLFVFIQAGGVKHIEEKKHQVGQDEQGRPMYKTYHEPTKLFSHHGYIVVIVLLVLAGLIFAGAGGLNLTNISLPIDPMGALFLGMIALAIFWLITEGKGK